KPSICWAFCISCGSVQIVTAASCTAFSGTDAPEFAARSKSHRRLYSTLFKKVLQLFLIHRLDKLAPDQPVSETFGVYAHHAGGQKRRGCLASRSPFEGKDRVALEATTQ